MNFHTLALDGHETKHAKNIFHLHNFPIPLTCKYVYMHQNRLRRPLGIQFHVFQMNTIMFDVFPTFFHPQLWHIPHCNSIALMFCQCVPLTTNDFFFVLNQWTHSTLSHHIYKPSLKHQALYPWHANYSFSLKFANVVIRLFLSFPFIFLFLTRWNKRRVIKLKLK